MNNKDFEKAFGNFSLSDFMQECKEDFENAIPTGLYFESGQELKLQRGNITLISSKSGDGQTSVITSMAINDAIRNIKEKTGEMTVFINHEEARGKQLLIMLNNYVGVPYGNYSSGEICSIMANYIQKRGNFVQGALPNGKTYQEDFDEKQKGFLELISGNKASLLLIDGMQIQLDKLVEVMKQVFEQYKVSTIFIDNLDLRYFESEDDIKGSLRKIKDLAKEYNVAVVFAHHLTFKGKLYEENKLIYDTCIGVHLIKDKNLVYAKVLRDNGLGVGENSTAYWQWVGQCKKIISNTQTL